ncbi:MAG: molybdopterin molybdotransferase MoeA [Gammaproteobacteria bacterium]|nr:molybdopterin molybdotransferase MoeA [Gammaproteobacteria bacterium]
MDLSEAREKILNSLKRLSGSESVAVARACNRVAMQPARALVSLPPFPCSAMDGYAIRFDDLEGSPPYVMKLIGQSLAGHPYDGESAPGECIRIFTGAPMPTGLDCVVIQENCSTDGAEVHLLENVSAGANVRPMGHDILKGDPVVETGKIITAFDVGWLAACGITHVQVVRKLRVALFSTGDELADPGAKLDYGQIYESNRFTLTQLLAGIPLEIDDLGILPDDPELIETAMLQAANSCDVLLTSGGVSVGDADFVKEVLQKIGHLEIWRLNLKPGKPLAFGRINDALFFGLPGNPVSTIVTFLLMVKPALLALSGVASSEPLSFTATLREPIKHKPGREEYQRGRLTRIDEQTFVDVTGDQSSNRMATFSDADCLIKIPKTCGDLATNSSVSVLPFKGLL